MEFVIKEQPVEILYFNDFEKEIENSHLEYLKSQISKSDYERLDIALKNKDIVECAAITKYWVSGITFGDSGMFRKYIAYHKKEDGSYNLQHGHTEVTFRRGDCLFILSNGIAIPVNTWQRDNLIKLKQTKS